MNAITVFAAPIVLAFGGCAAAPPPCTSLARVELARLTREPDTHAAARVLALIGIALLVELFLAGWAGVRRGARSADVSSVRENEEPAAGQGSVA